MDVRKAEPIDTTTIHVITDISPHLYRDVPGDPRGAALRREPAHHHARHAFDVLGDPVRRRILELLADGELRSGEIVAVVQQEFGITQAAVSQHLRVLRENGFASVRVDGPRRIYTVESEPLQAVDAWLERFRGFWAPKLSALETEIARGRRQRRKRRTST